MGNGITERLQFRVGRHQLSGPLADAAFQFPVEGADFGFRLAACRQAAEVESCRRRARDEFAAAADEAAAEAAVRAVQAAYRVASSAPEEPPLILKRVG